MEFACQREGIKGYKLFFLWPELTFLKDREEIPTGDLKEKSVRAYILANTEICDLHNITISGIPIEVLYVRFSRAFSEKKDTYFHYGSCEYGLGNKILYLGKQL